MDQVIHALAHAGKVLPEDAMRWALDSWDVAGPRFVALLGRCADGDDRSEETADALFFAIHLLGERREPAAFPALCRLLQDAEASRQVLGEAITETLCGLLISTYDGDVGALKAVIESGSAGEFARAAALEAMTYLTRTGAFTDAETRAYLLHLLMEMRPRAPCFVWSGWALAVANLGYADYAGEVRRLLRRGFIWSGDMNMDDFNEQLRRTLGDPDGMAGLAFDRIGPFTDAIGTLSGWYCFSEEYRLEAERIAARLEELTALPPAEEPYINPLRHIGRNDPCPCGSGRKYKKCCLQ